MIGAHRPSGVMIAMAAEAPELAYRAAAAALASSGLAADEITHLITVTCTGFNAPGIDIALIDRLGLPRTTERIQVGFMGCHAAINGLRAARGLVAANPDAKVLVCCVELCSLHFQYGDDTDLIVSNALFADGAAAMVIGHGTARGRRSRCVARIGGGIGTSRGDRFLLDSQTAAMP